jgi:hypothetical protein
MASAANYEAFLFKADGTLVWQKNLQGLTEKSGGKHWPYGAVPTGIGLWEPKPGLKRILVGGYCYMSLLEPASGEIVNNLIFGNSRYAWKILKQQPDLDGDGNREAFLFHYVNNSSPGDANIVRLKPDGNLEAFSYCALIPDGKFAAELTEDKKPKLSVIGPRGFGYYQTDTSLKGSKIYNITLWSQLGTRPISAGALLDLNGDGKKDFLVGGEDGFISAFNRDDGQLLSSVALGRPVLDLLGFTNGGQPVIIANSGEALLAYDQNLKVIARHEGQYRKLAIFKEKDRSFIAIDDKGALRIIKIQ